MCNVGRGDGDIEEAETGEQYIQDGEDPDSCSRAAETRHHHRRNDSIEVPQGAEEILGIVSKDRG